MERTGTNQKTPERESRNSPGGVSLRVLVCGGRDFKDRDFIHNTLCDLHAKRGPFEVVIHGDATGADSEAEIWASLMNIKSLPFRPDWHTHGKAAGPIRNQRMILDGRPDLVVAFPGGRGTADMVNQARKNQIEVFLPSPPS